MGKNKYKAKEATEPKKFEENGMKKISSGKLYNMYVEMVTNAA